MAAARAAFVAMSGPVAGHGRLGQATSAIAWQVVACSRAVIAAQVCCGSLAAATVRSTSFQDAFGAPAGSRR